MKKQIPTDMKKETFYLAWRLLIKRPDLIGDTFDYALGCYHLHRFTHENAIPDIDKRLMQLNLSRNHNHH